MRKKGKWLGKLVQFELLYRVCLYLFVNPLLSQLLRLYLSRARSGMTFNSDIISAQLSRERQFLNKLAFLFLFRSNRNLMPHFYINFVMSHQGSCRLQISGKQERGGKFRGIIKRFKGEYDHA